MNRRRLSILLVLAPLLIWVSPVEAHAVLIRATPAAASAVHASPAMVQLWFSERVEAAFSSVEILDGAGKRVDAGDSHVDGADPKSLMVSLPHLASGTYRVAWRVLSVDTHVSKGEYRFDIAP